MLVPHLYLRLIGAASAVSAAVAAHPNATSFSTGADFARELKPKSSKHAKTSKKSSHYAKTSKEKNEPWRTSRRARKPSRVRGSTIAPRASATSGSLLFPARATAARILNGNTPQSVASLRGIPRAGIIRASWAGTHPRALRGSKWATWNSPPRLSSRAAVRTKSSANWAPRWRQCYQRCVAHIEIVELRWSY